LKELFLTKLYEYLNNDILLTELQSAFKPMFSAETVLLKATNEWLWSVDNNLLNGVIFLDTWIMLSYWESLQSMGSVLNLLPGSGPIYLTESNKRLLMQLNLISVI